MDINLYDYPQEQSICYIKYCGDRENATDVIIHALGDQSDVTLK